jgi:hypothetical protein
LEELRQFNGMKTGQTTVDTLDFAASLSGSSSQSSSSDESASKRHKTTGTYPINTTEIITSKKVDVDMDLLKKVESEGVKAEKKRAKEANEANRRICIYRCEGSEVQQKAIEIEEANLLGRESKEERKRVKVEVKVEAKERAKELKEERKRVKVEAKVEAKKRAKERAKELKEEKKVALALAALTVPTPVCQRVNGLAGIEGAPSGKCNYRPTEKNWHLGRFGFDDHTKAVALYKRHESKTKTELEALFNRQ